jgi:hypothetical protein
MLENLLDFFHALTHIPSKIGDCSHEGNWGPYTKVFITTACVFHISLPWVFVCVSILSIIVCE